MSAQKRRHVLDRKDTGGTVQTDRRIMETSKLGRSMAHLGYMEVALFASDLEDWESHSRHTIKLCAARLSMAFADMCMCVSALMTQNSVIPNTLELILQKILLATREHQICCPI